MMRLLRWATLRPFPDPSARVVERLGLIRWADYPRTSAVGFFPDRRTLRRWEGLIEAVHPPEVLLQALSAGWGTGPGHLDLNHHLQREVMEQARAAERGDPEGALALYQAWIHAQHPRHLTAFRHSRTLEALERPTEALHILRAGLPSAPPERQLQLHRAGRRLARRLKRGWAPPPPLWGAPIRELRLTRGSSEARPLWWVGAQERLLEAAVCQWLSQHGRRGFHVEGGAWSTLFALLFADLWFLPVPGALPVRHLSRPLDLGTPAFRSARQPQLQRRLQALSEGGARALTAQAIHRWWGTRLSGASWDLLPPEDLLDVAATVPPAVLVGVMELFLSRGPRVRRGMPDLVVLPGEEVRLPAHPKRLLPGFVFAELKGPSDSLSDAQRLWLHTLHGLGARVELWQISAAR